MEVAKSSDQDLVLSVISLQLGIKIFTHKKNGWNKYGKKASEELKIIFINCLVHTHTHTQKASDVCHIICEDIPSPGPVLWGVMNGVKCKFLFCEKKPPTHKLSFSRWLVKLVHLYYGIRFSNQKEWNVDEGEWLGWILRAWHWVEKHVSQKITH